MFNALHDFKNVLLASLMTILLSVGDISVVPRYVVFLEYIKRGPRTDNP